MRKKFLLLLISLCCCSCLIACGNNSANATNSDTTNDKNSNQLAQIFHRPIKASKCFNTLDDAAEWGDEADFLRANAVQRGVIPVSPQAFDNQELLLKKGVRYALIGYIHNTSSKTRSDIIMKISYPAIVRADAENRASATITTADNTTGKGNISDTLALTADEDLELQLPNSKPGEVFAIDENQKSYTVPLTSKTVDGHVINTIELAAIAPDQSLMIFIIARAVLAE